MRIVKRLDSRILTFRDQIDLITDISKSGGKLASELDSLGYSYDDLTYQESKGLCWIDGHPQILDDLRIKSSSIPFISFFAGCGGMDLGFNAAGFDHLASFEFNEIFCKTLRKNHPNWDVYGPPVHSGDVSNITEIVETLSTKISRPFEGIFIGGPPCQPFSIAANQRFSKSGNNFKRTGFSHPKNGSLLLNYIKIIKTFKPKVFVIENVTGLRDLDGGKQLSEAITSLSKAGYTVEEPYVIDASNFGIPQHRIRLFVVGSRTNKKFKLPPVSAQKYGVSSVLGNIPYGVENHQTREHSASSILRYMMLSYGERDQLGRVDRLSPIKPSKTVIAGGTNGGGRSHLHPEIPRTLTVRESARIQTFPNDFVFVGPIARQFTQVGNAVPPVLAAKLALKIRECLF